MFVSSNRTARQEVEVNWKSESFVFLHRHRRHWILVESRFTVPLERLHRKSSRRDSPVLWRMLSWPSTTVLAVFKGNSRYKHVNWITLSVHVYSLFNRSLKLMEVLQSGKFWSALKYLPKKQSNAFYEIDIGYKHTRCVETQRYQKQINFFLFSYTYLMK